MLPRRPALVPACAGSELALSFHEDMFPQMSGRLREFGLGLSMLTLSAPKSHYMM